MSSTSRRLSASSYVPISSSGPATRSEAIGTLGRDRPDKAIIEPRGVLPIRMPIASSESVDSSASTPSRTITDGDVREESVGAEPRRHRVPDRLVRAVECLEDACAERLDPIDGRG